MNASLSDLVQIAQQAMKEKGFEAQFSKEALEETQFLTPPSITSSDSCKDLRHLLWFSIDNDDSKDLDQVTYAESQPQGKIKAYVGVADVDILVKKGSAIDQHAERNTTSVYTPTKIFNMLPEKFSTDLTSLNQGQDRNAIVVEMIISEKGAIDECFIYRAILNNHAKLTYNKVGAWLQTPSFVYEPLQKIQGLEEQLKLQDLLAQKLKRFRYSQGALSLKTIQSQPIIVDQQIVQIKEITKNRATELIEEFMIAANIAITRFLKQNQLPIFKRVVKTPKRWDRIVEVAQRYGAHLPDNPDSKALENFLLLAKQQNPLQFPDLSLVIIKLIGKGEYVIEYPGQISVGHFALGLKDYVHSTAPNRRFPDIILQRFIKAFLQNRSIPYSNGNLIQLALRCTQKEDDAEKVERRVQKSAAALLLSSKLNQVFDAIVTGSGIKGTWVRIFDPPVEGKLIKGQDKVDVGDRIKVKLTFVDVWQGFIDFEKET